MTQMVPPTKSNKSNAVNTKISIKVPPSKSVAGLPLFSVEKEGEIDGVGMGVLTNGVPYLTQAGVARMAGVTAKAIRVVSQNWLEERDKPRGKAIQQLLNEHGYDEDVLYLHIQVPTTNNQFIHAFPDVVCMAFLEYYAFEMRNETAIQNYRLLARKTLRDFIYEKVGYDPVAKLDSWKYFLDRVSLLTNAVPDGYFSIFQEMAGMTVDLIKCGFPVSDKTIPDISVGMNWASNWKIKNLAARFGEPTDYLHEYPMYYPQSMSNPQKPKAYPVGALGEFREWFKYTYLVHKFPVYILKKADCLPGGKDVAKNIIEVFQPKQIGQQ